MQTSPFVSGYNPALVGNPYTVATPAIPGLSAPAVYSTGIPGVVTTQKPVTVITEQKSWGGWGTWIIVFIILAIILTLLFYWANSSWMRGGSSVPGIPNPNHISWGKALGWGVVIAIIGTLIIWGLYTLAFHSSQKKVAVIA